MKALNSILLRYFTTLNLKHDFQKKETQFIFLKHFVTNPVYRNSSAWYNDPTLITNGGYLTNIDV